MPSAGSGKRLCLFVFFKKQTSKLREWSPLSLHALSKLSDSRLHPVLTRAQTLGGAVPSRPSPARRSVAPAQHQQGAGLLGSIQPRRQSAIKQDNSCETWQLNNTEDVGNGTQFQQMELKNKQSWNKLHRYLQREVLLLTRCSSQKSLQRKSAVMQMLKK